MSKVRGIIATTALDKHNEKLSLGCLEGIVDQINSHTLLTFVEHDPRTPPVGRIISGKIVKINNSDFGVEAEIEYFDEPSENNDLFKNRPLICDDDFSQNNKIQFEYDRNFENDDDQKVISELSVILKTKPKYSVKKSLDPISIFTIGGAFMAGGIFSGFFGEIGADGYRLLKEKLKKLFATEKVGEKERLLEFSFNAINGEKTITCKVILTNPSPVDIDSILDRGLKEFDDIVNAHFNAQMEYKLIVFEYKNSQFEPKYAVTNDGSTYHPK